MPLQITDESYNSLPALYANAGKWVTGSVKLRNCYRLASGVAMKVKSYADYFELENALWADFGFSDGDTVTIYLKKLTGNPATQYISFTMTVSYINGNKMFFTTSLNAAYQYKAFPTDGAFTGVFVVANKQPKSIDFRFNLALQGTGSLSSVVDEEINRFINNAVDSLAVSGSASLTQLGNKSGGLVESVTITRNANTTFTNSNVLGTATEYNYTIAFTFLQWGVFKEGGEVPPYYFADQCLQPVIEVSSYPQVNTANGKLSAKNGAQWSNVGWYDENYNGYPAAYSLTSLVLTDVDGNSLEQIAYNKPTLFTAVLSTPNQVNGSSNYRIGLAFTPITDDLYKNLSTAWKNNVLLNAPNLNYQHSATPDTTNRVGNTNVFGAGFDFDDLKFSHAADVLTVTGKIIPTDASVTFFDELADGERNLLLWIQVSDFTKTGQTNDEVNVLVYNDDCYSAPRIGVQWPDVVDDTLYDHAGIDVTDTTTPNTTTEDNILYVGRLLVPTDTEIDRIRVGVEAFNSDTGEYFTLEYVDFSTSGVPFISGVYEFNASVGRGFLLPPSTDRNIVSVTRDSSLDTTGKYGLKIQYGFLNRWEYWLAQSNVDEYFFDQAEPNNGKNKNWQRLQDGDWSLRLAYYAQIEGVDDYNYTPFLDRAYEDDPTVEATPVLTDVDGNILTALPDAGIVNLEVTFQWNNTFADEWAEITCENYEGARIGFISTVLDHDGQNGNCLIPTTGQTKLSKTAGLNSLICTCQIDCSQLPAGPVSFTYRTHSTPKDEYVYLITYRKDAALAYSVYKVSSDEVWDGPIMQVQRSSDNTTLDLYAGPSGLVDYQAAETFAGAGDARIRIWYDQSGAGCHATQTTYANMDEFIKAGSVLTDPDNGYPAAKRTTVTAYYSLAYALSQGAEFTQTMVSNRNGAASLSLGNASANIVSGAWLQSGDDRVVSTFGAAGYSYGVNLTADSNLLTFVHKTTDVSYYQLNGVTTGAIAGDTTVDKSYIYLNRAGSDYGGGYFQELIVWQKDKTDSLPEISSNTLTRYGL